MNLKYELLKQGYKADELKTVDGHEKHIYSEGSREHVLSYHTNGISCSNSKCIVNVNSKIPDRKNRLFTEKGVPNGIRYFKTTRRKK